MYVFGYTQVLNFKLEKTKVFSFFNFLKIIYLFIQREREREAETQAEGEAGSMQGA